jgi:hypothetical protein
VQLAPTKPGVTAMWYARQLWRKPAKKADRASPRAALRQGRAFQLAPDTRRARLMLVSVRARRRSHWIDAWPPLPLQEIGVVEPRRGPDPPQCLQAVNPMTFVEQGFSEVSIALSGGPGDHVTLGHHLETMTNGIPDSHGESSCEQSCFHNCRTKSDLDRCVAHSIR